MKKKLRAAPPQPSVEHEKRTRRAHGRFFFEDWSMADPLHEPLSEAMHTARYDLARLTQAQAYLILGAAESYVHLAAHPADTASIIAQLRKVRAAVREANNVSAPQAPPSIPKATE